MHGTNLPSGRTAIGPMARSRPIRSPGITLSCASKTKWRRCARWYGLHSPICTRPFPTAKGRRCCARRCLWPITTRTTWANWLWLSKCWAPGRRIEFSGDRFQERRSFTPCGITDRCHFRIRRGWHGPRELNLNIRRVSSLAVLALGFLFSRAEANAQNLTLEGQTGGFITPTAYVVYTENGHIFSHPAVGYHFVNTHKVIGDIH